MKKRLVIIGSGPAGLVCALSACNNGILPKDILIIEREDELGGVLNQCIHTGYLKSLTGTELASRLIKKVQDKEIEYMTGTSVLFFDRDKIITVVSPKMGYTKIEAEAIVLATGCREKSRGGLSIGGTRPAGILSAGAAQRYVNIEGYMPGKKTVIIGSTNLALIVARRLVLEGGEVVCVCETKGSAKADKKNIKECLKEFRIPLMLSHTVSRIYGKERIEAVEICELDKHGKIVKGTRHKVECDSLIYSCGYIPDTDIAKDAGITLKKTTKGPSVNKNYETNISGVFACGNALYIHDSVDEIMKESKNIGYHVAKYLVKNTREEVAK